MVKQLLACMAVLAGISTQSDAGGSAFEDLVHEILARNYGAPMNSRNEIYQRLRHPADVVTEAVWRIDNLRLRPAGGAALWPRAADERYEVRGCAAHRVVRMKSPIAGVSPRAATASGWASLRRASSREAPAARKVALVLAPTSILAVEALASVDEKLVFSGSFILDAEVSSEVVRVDAPRTEALLGREPEGTLNRLVPDLAARTAEIEGAIWLARTDPGDVEFCPRVEFTTQLGQGRSSVTLTCELEPRSVGC